MIRMSVNRIFASFAFTRVFHFLCPKIQGGRQFFSDKLDGKMLFLKTLQNGAVGSCRFCGSYSWAFLNERSCRFCDDGTLYRTMKGLCRLYWKTVR